MKTYDVTHEEYRVYMYKDGVELEIEEPVTLFISESGSHRVLKKGGTVTYPRKDWVCVYWKPKDPSNPVKF